MNKIFSHIDLALSDAPTGNGSGNGNRYGAAAAFGILIIPVVFVRVAAPMNMFQTILMFAVRLTQTNCFHSSFNLVYRLLCLSLSDIPGSMAT